MRGFAIVTGNLFVWHADNDATWRLQVNNKRPPMEFIWILLNFLEI